MPARPVAQSRSNRTLGSLIRLVRTRNDWTLREMSEKVGIPLSTLAKVEADKLSLSYDKLQQLTEKLGLTLAEFLGLGEPPTTDASRPMVNGRRSLTGPDNTIRVETPTYDYQYLCADLRQKRMVPIIVRVHARDTKAFGELVKHKGEEFVYVLEGTIEVHLQFYTPVILTSGQGIYLDSTMEHVYLTKDCESALVLAICSSEDPDLASELINRVNR